MKILTEDLQTMLQQCAHFRSGMMKQIPSLKLFSKEELYFLLSACSQSLTHAYQEINECDFWHIAMQARLACEGLRFEIDSQKKDYLIH